jgi:hypothetical protein
MKTHTAEIDLLIDGINLKVGHEILEEIAEYIPDTKNYKQIFEKLASNSNYMVRENIAKKSCLNTKTIKILLKDKRHGIVTQLLRSTTVNNKLTPKQIKYILSLDNPIHCQIIARAITSFIKCDIYKLTKILSKHSDPKVRKELVQRWDTEIPKKIVKKLTKDKDIDVACAAKNKIKQYKNC